QLPGGLRQDRNPAAGLQTDVDTQSRNRRALSRICRCPPCRERLERPALLPASHGQGLAGSGRDRRRVATAADGRASGGNPVKVVLFCGGLGTRLREYTGEIPKPMVKIGYRPIIWHLMKYYAHFGHKDFVLCLGYKGDVINEFFLRYEEWISNDFTLSQGGKHLELENNDIEDWNITFV